MTEGEQNAAGATENVVTEVEEVVTDQETATEAATEQAVDQAGGEVAKIEHAALAELEALAAKFHELIDSVGLSQELDFAKMHVTNAVEYVQKHLQAVGL